METYEQKHKKIESVLNEALRSVWDKGPNSPKTLARLSEVNRMYRSSKFDIEVAASDDTLLVFLKATRLYQPVEASEVVGSFPYSYILVQMAGYVEYTDARGRVFVIKDRYSDPRQIEESVRNKKDAWPWVRPVGMHRGDFSVLMGPTRTGI